MQFSSFEGETIKGAQVFTDWCLDLRGALVPDDGVTEEHSPKRTASVLRLEVFNFIVDTIDGIENNPENKLFDCWMFCEMLLDQITYRASSFLNNVVSNELLKEIEPIIREEEERMKIVLEEYLLLSINSKKYEDYVEEEIYEKQTENKEKLYLIQIDSKKINLKIHDTILNNISKKILERLEVAIDKGFVHSFGETGIKQLAEIGNLKLLEVKVLGNMQNGKCKIGDLRLMCIWDTRENIIYGFAMMKHKEVCKTTESFKKNPCNFHEKVMETFNQQSFVNMISSNQGFSHGY
jgi:hypothetical protein